jgi:5'-nucleotidase
VDGTPADCINLGVYHVFQQKPDLVVSGINIGINTGLGFALSSGTIGACLEANIAGIPAVALSQELARETFAAWMTNRSLPELEVERLRSQTDMLLDRVFERLFARPDFLLQPVTWNVNFPDRLVPIGNWCQRPWDIRSMGPALKSMVTVSSTSWMAPSTIRAITPIVG